MENTEFVSGENRKSKLLQDRRKTRERGDSEDDRASREKSVGREKNKVKLWLCRHKGRLKSVTIPQRAPDLVQICDRKCRTEEGNAKCLVVP